MRTALIATALLGLAPLRAGAQEPVVHAVLFYSPTCPHCHEVINNVLPPLHDKYGDRLVIAGVDITKERGAALYRATAAYFALPESRLGVPALLVGLELMVGSAEIPEHFPGIIERGLAEGGIDWPPIEDVREALTAQGIIQRQAAPAPSVQPAATPPTDTTKPTTGVAVPPRTDTVPPRTDTTPPPSTAVARDTARPGGRPDTALPSAAQAAPAGPLPGAAPATAATASSADTTAVPDTTAAGAASGAAAAPGVALMPDTAILIEQPTTSQLFLRDPVGNGIAVAVLLLLLATLAWSLRVLLRPGAAQPAAWPSWVFPALGVVGAGVAAYLSYVEVTGAQAVCGPVGDCNTVQQSQWSRLFGVPVGVAGLVGYVAMLTAWAFASWGPPRTRVTALKLAWVMALAGTAISAWLTFLEPFVIGATCAWCVTSAVVIALMLAEATARVARPGSS